MTIKSKVVCTCGACDPVNDYSEALPSEIIDLFVKRSNGLHWANFDAFIEALQEAGYVKDFEPHYTALLKPFDKWAIADFEDMINYPNYCDHIFKTDKDTAESFLIYLAQRLIKEGEK